MLPRSRPGGMADKRFKDKAAEVGVRGAANQRYSSRKRKRAATSSNCRGLRVGSREITIGNGSLQARPLSEYIPVRLKQEDGPVEPLLRFVPLLSHPVCPCISDSRSCRPPSLLRPLGPDRRRSHLAEVPIMALPSGPRHRWSSARPRLAAVWTTPDRARARSCSCCCRRRPCQDPRSSWRFGSCCAADEVFLVGLWARRAIQVPVDGFAGPFLEAPLTGWAVGSSRGRDLAPARCDSAPRRADDPASDPVRRRRRRGR